MLLGVDFSGKRLGIFGMGRIGQAIAQRARAFGLQIHYHNRRRLPAGEEHGAIFHERLDALLPYGAMVVNTARGDMVEDAALIAAFKTGRLRAAGLDVFAGEPRLNPAYLDLPNAYLLPHLGSATVETRDRMGFMALDNIDAVLQGRPAPYPL